MDNNDEAEGQIMASTMNAYRKEGKYCDVVLKVGKKEFPCHRDFLSKRAEYFQIMFGGNFKEKDEAVIKLKDIDEKGFELVIECLYGEKPTFSSSIKEALIVASYLRIPEIRSIYGNFLNSYLTVNTVCQVYNIIAAEFSFLQHRCTKLIKQNFPIICKSPNSVDLPFQVLQQIISYKNTIIKNELDFFNMVDRWISHNMNERLKYKTCLLNSVCMKCVKSSPEFDSDTIKNVLSSPLYVGYKFSEGCFGGLTRDNHQRLYIFGEMKIKNCRKLTAIQIDGKKLKVQHVPQMAMDVKNPKFNVCRSKSRIYTFSHDCTKLAMEFSYFSMETDSRTSVKLPDTFLPVHSIVSDSSDSHYIYANSSLWPEQKTDYHLHRYDTLTDSWSTVLSDSSIGGACLVSYENVIYIFGGLKNRNLCTQAQYSVKMFDPRTGKLSNCCQQVMDITAAAGTVLENDIYVSGGLSYKFFEQSVRYKPTGDLRMYSTRANRWELLSSMWVNRQEHSLVTYKGKLWAVGGSDNNVVEIYDTKVDFWQDKLTSYSVFIPKCNIKALVY